MKKRMALGLIFCIILSLCGCKKDGKVDSEQAFRDIRSVDSNDVIYLDEEAIALSDILLDENLREIAIETCNEINRIRMNNGLNALKWNGKLEQVAEVRAKESSQSFSHTRPNGSQWYTVNSKIQGGENLAYGFTTPTDVVDAWMNSYSHRDNILYDEFKTTAIAIYKVDGVYYWTQQFGY